MKQFVLDRLREPSTWRGAVLLATACGVKLSPEISDAIVAAGLGLAGLIGLLAKG